MARKLFIVARGNVQTYESLHRSIRHEPGVEIIYDRRAETARPRRGIVRRFGMSWWAGVPPPERAERERRREHIDEELRTRGWAVVRDQSSPGDVRPRAGGLSAPSPAAGFPRERPTTVPGVGRDQVRRPHDEVVPPRDEIPRPRDEVVPQRNEVPRPHDEVVRKRDEVAQQRDEVAQQRDEVAQKRDEVMRKRFTRRRIDDAAETGARKERDEELLASQPWPPELPPEASAIRDFVNRVLVVVLVVGAILVIAACVAILLMF
jgi:hypothetical protein